MTRSSERERVRLLEVTLGAKPDGVRVAIGDDAAVLTTGPGEVVWSIDAAVEGVHFRRDWMTLEDVGYRSTMAALSDLAAMGAEPIGVLSALVLPDALSDDELVAIARGQRAAAEAARTAVLGGNLARGDALSITTTVLGAAPSTVLRGTAKSGDVVFVAGPLGLSRAGLLAAQRGEPGTASTREAFLRPRALVADGVAARRAGATAMIDVSDGLAADASQLADASGLTIELDVGALEIGELTVAAALLGVDPIETALAGGEDYALLATFPAGVAPPDAFSAVGRCVERSDASVLVVDATGSRRAAAATGWDHFVRRPP